MKTVRFSEVVATAGEPEPYVLWLDPNKDPEFQRAVKKNRVMTVHQDNVGAKKDFGVVGFTKNPHAEFLVFPKPLGRFAGKRIVGLKYDLLKSLPRKPPGQKKEKETYPVYVDRHALSLQAPSAPDKSSHERRAAPEKVREIENTPISPTPQPTGEKQRAAPEAPKSEDRPKKLKQPAKTEPQSTTAQKEEGALAKEVRRALKELKAGKAVVAYQRLEKALEATTK